MEDKKPKLRFQGFDEDWKKKRLDEIIQLNSGMDYKHLEDGDIPVYGTGGYMLNVNKALSYNEDAIGIGRKGTIDKPFILKAPFWTVDTLFYAIPKKNNDLQFCNCLFQKVDWRKHDESTGVPSLSKNIINAVEVNSTLNFTEQKKIGEFFEELDELICAKEQEVEKLKQIKAALLDKMFPNNDSDKPNLGGNEVIYSILQNKNLVYCGDKPNVPCIRFRGFTEPWERKTIKELMQFPLDYGLNIAAKKYDGRRKYLRITDIDEDTRIFVKKDITSPNLENIPSCYQLSEGDIVFARTGASVGKTYLYNKMDGEVYFAGFLIRGKIKIENDPYFIFTNTLTEEYAKFIKVTSQRTGQPGVNALEYENYSFLVPRENAEQKQIGNFFREQDETIQNAQYQIIKLRNMKQACLQKMFA